MFCAIRLRHRRERIPAQRAQVRKGEHRCILWAVREHLWERIGAHPLQRMHRCSCFFCGQLWHLWFQRSAVVTRIFRRPPCRLHRQLHERCAHATASVHRGYDCGYRGNMKLLAPNGINRLDRRLQSHPERGRLRADHSNYSSQEVTDVSTPKRPTSFGCEVRRHFLWTRRGALRASDARDNDSARSGSPAVMRVDRRGVRQRLPPPRDHSHDESEAPIEASAYWCAGLEIERESASENTNRLFLELRSPRLSPQKLAQRKLCGCEAPV